MNKKVRKPKNATLQISVAVLAGNANEGYSTDLIFYLSLEDGQVRTSAPEEVINKVMNRDALLPLLQGAIAQAVNQFNDRNKDWEKENWGRVI